MLEQNRAFFTMLEQQDLSAGSTFPADCFSVALPMTINFNTCKRPTFWSYIRGMSDMPSLAGGGVLLSYIKVPNLSIPSIPTVP